MAGMVGVLRVVSVAKVAVTVVAAVRMMVAAVRMMVALVPGVSVAKVAITVVAAVQVVTKLAVGTEKIARSKRASSRPHHDRELL